MMRACVMGAIVLGLAGVAHAESVNLLSAVPTTVAVSSTVDNPQILPAHLVDGKLDTAWNSVTGELEGAWFGVKLPDDAVVDTIKLTVGFTRVDKRYGDLFTLNPRIAAVQITRDDREVARVDLDPTVRTLQAIPVGKLRGGTIVIHVTKVVAGSRAAWREVNVSELEVWGTPGPSARPGRYTPTMYVGSFTHSVATRAQCLAALPPPRGAKITRVDVDELADDVGVCVVERATTGTSTIAAVGAFRHGAKLAALARLPDIELERGPTDHEFLGDGAERTASLELGTYDLTTTERALRIVVKREQVHVSMSEEHTTDTFYRATAKGLVKILDNDTGAIGSTNGGTWRHCELGAVPQLTASLPARLPVHCTIHHEAYRGGERDDHGELVDHDWEKAVDNAWVWRGDHYVYEPSAADTDDAP